MNCSIKEERPIIYILDASINITGAFVCARNEAVCLDGIAQVVLVLPSESKILEKELKPFAKVLRLPIVNLRRTISSFIYYIPALVIASWRLRQAMKADKALTLQLNDFYLMHGAMCRLFGYRRNIVTWIRFDPRRFGRLLSWLWLRIGVSISNRMIAVSKFIQSTLPIGIETTLSYDTIPFVNEHEQITSHLKSLQSRQKKLVYVGNYIQGKGQDDAIKAFAHIAEQFPEISLAFYGSDMGLEKNRVYRSDLEKMAKQFGLDSRIHFGEFVANTSTVLHNAFGALNFSYSESFSLTVLEAGYAGLPVIATKSGGPSEIIEDGITGILVPIGDIDAMSSAIAKLANNPAGAKLMGNSAQRLVRKRFFPREFSIRIATEFEFRSNLTIMSKVLGLSLYGPLAASTRYRLEQYISGLSEYGIDLQVHHLLGNKYLHCRFQGKKLPLLNLIQAGCKRLSLLIRDQHFDAAIVYAELFPFIPGWLERRLLKKPYIYDFDDAFYLKYRRGKFSLLEPILGKKIEQVIAGAAAVTAGNKRLLDHAKVINKKSFLFPTVVDLKRYQSRKQSSSEKPFTVGWIGSPSTSSYLKTIVRPLSTLGLEGPVRLVVVGGVAPTIPHVEVIEKKWQEETEIALINSFDVGIMPLHDDEWARGKCAFKLIQYMACGVPVVASRVGANIDVVQPDCGILASDDNEWLEALRIMRDQPHLRQKMGGAGRHCIQKHYSLQQNTPQLAKILHDITS